MQLTRERTSNQSSLESAPTMSLRTLARKPISVLVATTCLYETTARNPLARALLYNLRDLDADGIDDQFDAVRKVMLTHAGRTRVFEQPVNVAIDIHDWLFYSEETTPKVANTNPDQETNLAYKFATICIVDPDVRFTLDWTLRLVMNIIRDSRMVV